MVGVGFNEDLGRYAWVYRDGESSQLPVDGDEVAGATCRCPTAPRLQC